MLPDDEVVWEEEVKEGRRVEGRERDRLVSESAGQRHQRCKRLFDVLSTMPKSRCQTLLVYNRAFHPSQFFYTEWHEQPRGDQETRAVLHLSEV